MPENANARFLASAPLKLSAHNRADSTQSRLADFRVPRGSHELTVSFARTFRDNDDGEPFPEALAFVNFRADALVAERNLWNQDHVRTACDAGIKRNPTRVTAHDFE